MVVVPVIAHQRVCWAGDLVNQGIACYSHFLETMPGTRGRARLECSTLTEGPADIEVTG